MSKRNNNKRSSLKMLAVATAAAMMLTVTPVMAEGDCTHNIPTLSETIPVTDSSRVRVLEIRVEELEALVISTLVRNHPPPQRKPKNAHLRAMYNAEEDDYNKKRGGDCSIM